MKLRERERERELTCRVEAAADEGSGEDKSMIGSFGGRSGISVNRMEMDNKFFLLFFSCGTLDGLEKREFCVNERLVLRKLQV